MYKRHNPFFYKKPPHKDTAKKVNIQLASNYFRRIFVLMLFFLKKKNSIILSPRLAVSDIITIFVVSSGGRVLLVFNPPPTEGVPIPPCYPLYGGVPSRIPPPRGGVFGCLGGLIPFAKWGYVFKNFWKKFWVKVPPCWGSS